MKTLLLTLLTYCFFINITPLHAQKGMVDKRLYAYTNMTTLDSSFFMKETKTRKYSFTVGFVLDCYIRDHLVFSTGIGLAQKGRSLEQKSTPTTITTSTNYNYQLDFANFNNDRGSLNTYYIEIPLGIKYHFGSSKWYFSNGIAVQTRIYTEEEFLKTHSKVPFFISTHLGLGRNFSIGNNNKALSIQARAERELTDIFKPSNLFSYHVYQSFGLAIGLIY